MSQPDINLSLPDGASNIGVSIFGSAGANPTVTYTHEGKRTQVSAQKDKNGNIEISQGSPQKNPTSGLVVGPGEHIVFSGIKIDVGNFDFGSGNNASEVLSRMKQAMEKSTKTTTTITKNEFCESITIVESE